MHIEVIFLTNVMSEIMEAQQDFQWEGMPWNRALFLEFQIQLIELATSTRITTLHYREWLLSMIFKQFAKELIGDKNLTSCQANPINSWHKNTKKIDDAESLCHWDKGCIEAEEADPWNLTCHPSKASCKSVSIAAKTFKEGPTNSKLHYPKKWLVNCYKDGSRHL